MEIKIEYVPVADIIPYAGNPKDHPESQIQEIMGSIKKFGFVSPILLQGDSTIIAGHGRLIAAKRLKMEKVPCVRLDHLSPVQARQLVIMDNKIAENGDWNLEALKLELEDLKLQNVDISGLGFDASELTNLFTKMEDSEEDEKIKGDVPFSECIGETNQYVVLTFKNEIDWLAACEHFNIEPAKSRRQNGLEWTIGTGRVLDGAQYLEKVMKDV